jgi:hypothetical protein
MDMRAIDITTSGAVWVYRPARHKNTHCGKDRVIFLGPQGQEVIKPYHKQRQRHSHRRRRQVARALRPPFAPIEFSPMSVAPIFARLKKEIAAVRDIARAQGGRRQRYDGDPVGYIRGVLQGDPTKVQEEIARLLHLPPYRVLVRASYNVGKTWLCGALANYWFDTYSPGCVLTTARRADDVKMLLWREIRLQRYGAQLGGFAGKSECMLFDNPSHYMQGFTAERAESFRGRHLERMLWVVDEASGVPPIFWEGFASQFKPDGLHAAIAINAARMMRMPSI